MSRKLDAAVNEWRLLNLRSCVICGADNFGIAEVVDMPFAVQPSEERLDVMSFVPLVCDSCGHTVFVTAAHLGLKREDYGK